MVDTKKEFRKVLAGAGVILAVVVFVLAAIYLGRYLTETIENRPVEPEVLAYEMLPMDRVKVGQFAVNLGFDASPDSIIGVGDESVYRWGSREESAQFLEVSFKEGYIDYQAKPLKDATPSASPKVSEMIVARRLAWDFLLVGDLWDPRVEVVPDVRLFSKDVGGVESRVGSFAEANYFKVYFEGEVTKMTQETKVTKDDTEAPILAPDFEVYLAKVELYGRTGQVVRARVYPVFLGGAVPVGEIPCNEAMPADSSTLRVEEEEPLGSFSVGSAACVATLENPKRPEEGFLPEGARVFVAKKGEWLRLWEAGAATTKQVFRTINNLK